MSVTTAPLHGEDEELRKPGFASEALPQMDAVYRFALRLTQGGPEEAEDLVQETYLRAYRAWESYRPGTSARSWLFTICRNAFLRGRERESGRRETQASQLEADLEAIAATDVFGAAPAADPERAYFDSFVDGEVLAEIDRLPVEYREVVVLSDLQGLSYAAIAEVLGTPIGTVRSRLYRGRRLLQKALYHYALEAGYIRRREEPPARARPARGRRTPRLELAAAY